MNIEKQYQFSHLFTYFAIDLKILFFFQKIIKKHKFDMLLAEAHDTLFPE